MPDKRFDTLSKNKNGRLSSNNSKETTFSRKTPGELKLISMNTNSIRGQKLVLLAFLEVHQLNVVALQYSGTKN